MHTFSSGLFVVAVVGAGLQAQVWQAAAPLASPPARLAHAMAGDASAAHVLLFGGSPGSGFLGDTWSFDGLTWTQLAGAAPSARSGHAMAFDAGRGRAVLFGGINGTALSSYQFDTWEHDGATWQQRVVSVHPGARFGHAMAYDPVRARVVLFGGRTNAGTVFTNDTWEWDGTAWTPRTPVASPARRMGHAMAFDPVSNRVLLFGGQPIGALPLNDTWAWDGSNWTLLAPANAPAPRMQPAMALDQGRGRVVLYGGYYNGADVLDTVAWNGSDWQVVPTPVQPDAPALPAMASGPTGHHVVLFGGALGNGAALANTWWFGDVAGAQAFGVGCGPTAFTLAAEVGSRPVLGQTFVSRLDAVVSGGLPFLSFGLSATAFGAVPLPLALDGLGMPGCFLYHDLVLLGVACAPSGSGFVATLALPGSPSLAGMSLYAQGYALAFGVNAMNLVTSNGLALRLGY